MDIGEPAGLWVPALMARQATLELDRVLDRRMAWVNVIGRLKSDVTIEQAKAGLQGWFIGCSATAGVSATRGAP